jgi:FKBP-type peptidyl-prolyl cis-trans isomerase FklB
MKKLLASVAMSALALTACSNNTEEADMDTDTSATETSAAETTADAGHVETATEVLAMVNPAVESARACLTPSDASIPFVEALESGNGDPEANAAASIAYLDMVRDETCVFELESGLLFRIRQAAEEGGSPTSGDMVTVHYRGQFTHGGEFDSSYSRNQPATFPSDRLISGWVEALPLMRVGETWELFIAPDLAYGTRGTGDGTIGANEALVFTLELLDLPNQH